MRRIMNIFTEVKAHHIVLLCHHNADPDALCSAYAFSQLLKKIKPNLKIEVATPQGPSKISRHILESIPLTVFTSPHIEEADIIVLLDTNTIQQLGEWKTRVERSKKPLIIIDHHAPHPDTRRLATLSMFDESASSTCEIVFNLFKEMGQEMTREEASALFLGIAYDTRHFIIATSTTFEVVAELVRAGVKAEEVLPLLSMPMDLSERIARLKAAGRLRFTGMRKWLIAISHVGAYQASVARALINIGAHVAVVGGERASVIRISLRSLREFYCGTGIHLGRDIAKPLGEYIHGMGGGHSTSAGVNGEGDLKAALEMCESLFRSKFREDSPPLL
jgi:nanoRNase/pAp phosphatase (c-di-AMP/oligoRNAs hydrolase)